MKLQYLPALLALFALCSISSAVTAEEYCQAQATPCVKQCCPALGGTWSESEQDCIYPGAEDETLDDMLAGPCGSCANQMLTCLSTYQEAPLPPTIPPTPLSPGCCGSAAFIGLVGAAAFLRRR